MKRVIPSVILAILLVTLLSELFKVIDFYRVPAAFALLAHVSAVHDVVLHQYGLTFLLIKLLASLVVFACWCRLLLWPERLGWLRYGTFIYAGFQLLVGVLVVTGINGALHYAAGLPVALWDFSLLAAAGAWGVILYLGCVVVGVPLLLVILAQRHHRRIVGQQRGA
ncbi:hypothetical protein YSKK_06790 [Halopseudomonas aestusnigri]|nr:hypothetical protein YSKK_06790 [Halopseudomonas aestusnigri]